MNDMSFVMWKLSSGSLTGTTKNRAVHPQKNEKMARGLKFQIKKVEGLYHLCSNSKGADQLHVFSRMQKAYFLMTRLI